jgi:hypothetical protein
MSAKWSLLLLLTLMMGCEHTLGSAGFIEMAIDKDRHAQKKCDMPKDEWEMFCENPSSESERINRCPRECWPNSNRVY